MEGFRRLVLQVRLQGASDAVYGVLPGGSALDTAGLGGDEPIQPAPLVLPEMPKVWDREMHRPR